MLTKQPLQAHDLVWGMSTQLLNGPAPEWVTAELLAQRPAVVRRAAADTGYVAIGIRGPERGLRYPTWMPIAAIYHYVTPETLVETLDPLPAQPVLQVLAAIQPLLDGLGLAWGVTGGAGYQLATGVEVLHDNSDLDILLRTPYPLSLNLAVLIFN